MVGPGSVPLKVWAWAVTPPPMSTVASSATIVVSITFGAGSVSTMLGTVYALPPLVARPGERARISETAVTAAASTPASRMNRRPRHLAVVDADTRWDLVSCCARAGQHPAPHRTETGRTNGACRSIP